eukprot:COSAG02_NODE_5222_length_4527_cov_134.379630_6_plen_86_part_00
MMTAPQSRSFLTNTWADGLRKRKNLVPRTGDKLKMNKFPPAAQIDATQRKYQDKHERAQILPQLQFASDETKSRTPTTMARTSLA